MVFWIILCNGISATIVDLPGAQGAKITNDKIHGIYDPSPVQYVVSKGFLPTVVIANPFGADTDLILLKSITLPGYYPATDVSLITTKDRNNGHLIMIFDPVSTSNGLDACVSPSKQSTTPESKSVKNLHLLIVFCYDEEVVSEAYIEMRRPSYPTDRDFKRTITRLFIVLLPIEKPFLGGCQDVDKGNC